MDAVESFVYQNMTKQAANLLNQSHVQSELFKETTRRKIDKLRWQHNSVINLNTTGGQMSNTSMIYGDDGIDNPLKDGKDVLTMSLFSRPCNNNSQLHYQNKLFDDNYRQFSITSTKALFNPKVQKDQQQKMALALLEAEKVRSKIKPAPKKKQQQNNNKKKGEEEDEQPKPKEKTRSDYRILSLLREPFKAENYEYRTHQMREVEALKRHLASDNLNISADVIQKAIVLPEEDEREEERNYPKMGDHLLPNPFEKPKKKKGKKKGKK